LFFGRWFEAGEREAQKLKVSSNVLSRMRRLGWRRRGLARADDGTVSVEFMLWMPLIFTIILFTVDVALIYLKQADMWNVARDQARRMSVSSSYTPTSAQIEQNLFTSLQNAGSINATATGGGSANAGVDKVVTISVLLCDASLFGVVGCYTSGLTLTARVTMVSEY
jgi:Flp pilus assembly protein TadG